MVVGPFPPPTHGLATVTAKVAESLAARRRVRRVDLSSGRLPAAGAAGAAYHVGRVFRFLRAIASLPAFRASGGRTMYQACSGGRGLAYEAAIAAFARLFGVRLVAHHHSFLYIDRRSRLMAALMRVGGGDMAHVFLCDAMRRRFEAVYGPTRGLVLGNEAFLDRRPRPTRGKPGPPRIGLLSNLSREKGLHDFLGLLRTAAAEGVATGVLAGPAAGDDVALIEAARRELGPSLDYRGPLGGAEKARFYADIDVFVFPTRYAHEAQPLVICEAMAAGLPVLAYDRGCIAGQLGDALPPLARDADFAPWALGHLRRFAADPGEMARIGDANAARVAERADEGAAALRRLEELL